MIFFQKVGCNRMPKGSAPEITLTISNGSNQAHPAILLRKFFAMVFIEPGGKKLSIFIATVFGGVADDAKTRDGFPLVNYDKDPDKNCFLNFKFQSKTLSKSGCCVSDITDSFCHQTEQIGRVWCNTDEDGVIEHTDEKAAASKIKELYKELHQEGKAKVSLDPNSRPKVYEIKKGDSLAHHFMAIRGKFTSLQQDEPEYSLAVPIKVDGLEAINWVKTELVLTESILDHRIHFTVQLGPDQTFYTPDFTWYFAPPPGSAVNENTATLILGSNGKEIPNNIQNVRDDTTVLFKEWVELDIEDRRKARVQPKQLDQWQSPFTALSDAGRISVSFEIFDPQKESNRQFMVGLVVAFILAFCSDKTRINDFYECLKKICQCDATVETCACQILCNWISILAPFTVLITFYTYAYDPKRCLTSSWKDRHHRLWYGLNFLRCASFISFGVLAVYIFGLWPVATNIIGRFISCSWNKGIIIVLFFVNLLVSVLHIGIMKIRLKRSPKY